MQRWWPTWVALGAAALSRLWLAAVVPLTDTTEARYGEMARKMVETADWLVMQHDYGVPYLAKPPLAFWLSAMGVAALGPGEIGPRALILVATVAFCGLLFVGAKHWLGVRAAGTAVLIMASSLLFFVSAAAVMTDMVLTICVTAALAGFWERHRGGGGYAEVGLYVALGLGLLVKGPLAVVLAVGPIVIWAVAMGRVRRVWQQFAWLKGALLAAAIAVPWYLAAELRNPGFLQYFIVGEHLGRFLIPGWSGDLYGRAHDVPHGTILVFFLIGALPWCLLAVPWLWTARSRVREHWQVQREFVLFWLAAALVPLALFTFAGNVIWPYALPALPPFALALVALLEGKADTAPSPRVAFASAAAVVAVVVAAWAASPYIDTHSQRAVLRAAAALHPNVDVPLYYWQRRYFSVDYYGRGQVTVVQDEQTLIAALEARRGFELVVEARRLSTLPPAVAARLRRVSEVGEMLVLEPDYGVGAPAGA